MTVLGNVTEVTYMLYHLQKTSNMSNAAQWRSDTGVTAC